MNFGLFFSSSKTVEMQPPHLVARDVYIDLFFL